MPNHPTLTRPESKLSRRCDMPVAGTPISPVAQLDQQLTAKGIPIIGVAGPPWTVTYDLSATQAQKAQGDTIAAAFDGLDRVYRALWQIYQDVVALSGAQKTK